MNSSNKGKIFLKEYSPDYIKLVTDKSHKDRFLFFSNSWNKIGKLK